VRRRRALPYPNLGLSGVVPVPDGAPGSRQVVPPILDKPKIAASALAAAPRPAGGTAPKSCRACFASCQCCGCCRCRAGRMAGSGAAATPATTKPRYRPAALAVQLDARPQSCAADGRPARACAASKYDLVRPTWCTAGRDRVRNPPARRRGQQVRPGGQPGARRRGGARHLPRACAPAIGGRVV